MDTDIYRKDVVWDRGEGRGGKAKKAEGFPGLLPAVGIALLVVLALGYVVGHKEVGALQQQAKSMGEQAEARASEVAALRQQVGQLTPVCGDGAREIDQVRDFLGKGEFKLAARLAEVSLGQSARPLCPEPRTATAGLWYEASLRSIIATARPSWYDETLNQQVLSDWLSTERKADTYGVPKEKRWDALSVATVAANGGWWVWAEAASRRAWKADDGPSAAAFRYAILRNYGHNLAFDGPGQKREQAVRLLATAQAINVAFNLQRGEACEDLQRLGFADCNQPASDTADPALAAAGG